MSKLNIGVGDEFPLDETSAGERARRHHHHHHGHHHHGHFRHRGMLHLPLIVAVGVVAAMIGAGKISLPATHVILAAAAVVALLSLLARFWAHHRWHRKEA
jgi:hypothetical protein